MKDEEQGQVHIKAYVLFFVVVVRHQIDDFHPKNRAFFSRILFKVDAFNNDVFDLENI